MTLSRLELALKNSGLGIFDWDLQSQHIVWDAQHEALWGLSAGTFSGDIAGFLGAVDPKDTSRVLVELEEAKNHHRSFVSEFRVHWPDGSLHWIRSCGEFTYDDQGTAQRMVGTVADVTSQANAIRLIKESESRFRDLFEHLPIAYQSVNEEGRWLDANEAMAKLLGYPNSESMIGEDFLRHMTAAPQEVFREASVIERELPLTRLDGSTFEALISARIQRNSEGGFVRAHCIVLDVTERLETLRASEASKVALERMVSQRTAELEESLTMRNQFLAHMSHEIRNPMNIIGVNTHLLERTPLNDNQKGMVARTRRASSVMLSLLNEVLDYSKLEAGEITLETAPFSLCDLLKSLALLQGGAAEEKNLELVSSSDANAPDEWIGDRRRIEQVLINLSSNAIKFTDAGRIEINASVLHRPRQCCALRFEVTDTGCGIPADEIASLFQPFKQTRQNSQANIKGTGLGLSISKGLVELMGGTIGVQSTPGIGSSFWFSVPLPCAANHPDINSFNEGNDKFQGCRFLLVDDDEESRDSLKSLLEYEGAQCRVASNGQEGIEQLASRLRSFDAVLMDIQMPVMDGIEATRHIRQQLKLNHLPIIAVTGGLTLEQQHQAMESGITHLVKKPIKPEDLVSVLSRYCLKKQASVLALKAGEDPVSRA